MLKWAAFLAVVAIAVAYPKTGITKCFTCERADSNEECNGVDLDHSTSPHGNGTLHTCLFDNPTCFFRFKINEARNGYKVAKGCMDYVDCLSKYHWQWDDFNTCSCFFGNPDRGPPPVGLDQVAWPNAECIYCCALWQQGYNDKFYDGCNEHLPRKIPMPTPNDGWNETTDSWDRYPVKIVQVQPKGYASGFKSSARSAAQRHLFEVTFLVGAFGIAGALSL